MQWQEEASLDLSLGLPSQHNRREDEVERVGKSDCQLTTSIKTDYNGRLGATGTMFTIQPTEALEMLTLEFDAFELAKDLRVQVYYRKGEYHDVVNDPQKWTKLADSVAQLAPDFRGAIIPTNDFRSVSLDPGETYAIYLHFQIGTAMRIRSSDKLIGEMYESNEMLQMFVGVSLNDGPFPDTIDQAADFSGIIHYRIRGPCEAIRTTTDVELEFAVNEDPEADIMAALSDAVEGAITALMMLNPNLIRYKRFHLLELVEVESNFQKGYSKWMALIFFVQNSPLWLLRCIAGLESQEENVLMPLIRVH
jgi:hypothetical protein